MSCRWLEQLNPAQREAVTHGEGPLLIVAGAGTGKTKTLACRVAHLIDRGVSPGRILLLTFTRRAAAEMLRRADALSGRQASAKAWGGTFHAVGNRLLRIYGPAIGLVDFTVIDQTDAADTMNLLRSELGEAKDKRRFPRKQTLVSIYSRMVNAQDKLGKVLERHFPWCGHLQEEIKLIFDGYTQRKREQNVLDYDDLLLAWSILCTTPGVGEEVAGRFDHVLVDEYQDTNAVQGEILRGMGARHQNMVAVGDDAQSIYSFRAATVRNMLDFPQHFPGARIVTLEQNYRSTRPILAASNAVMEQASERYTKDLWSDRGGDQKPVLFSCLDEAEQCEAVCGQVLAHLEEGIPLQRQAVLFRASHHSDQLEVELARRKIPFHKYGGLKFIEAAHIKDMLAFLRILDNPFDEISWFRVLQLIEGIGPKTAGRLMQELGVRRRRSAQATEGRAVSDQPEFASPLKRLMDDPPSVPAPGRVEFLALRVVLAACCGVGLAEVAGSKGRTPARGSPSPAPGRDGAPTHVGPPAQVYPSHDPGRDGAPSGEDGEDLVGPGEARGARPALASQLELLRQFYEPLFERCYENASIRLADLEQLELIAQRYRSRSRFVTDLTLDPPTSTSDLAGPAFLEEDFLILSTIHSAKGCEWDAVHIIHAADGMIPSDMAVRDEAEVEEERRLFYVAMTRAKDWLYVYFPLRYYHRGKGMSDAHSFAQLTRFISRPVRKLFEDRVGPRLEQQDERVESASGMRTLDQRLGRLWED